jgi:hypothetical protein
MTIASLRRLVLGRSAMRLLDLLAARARIAAALRRTRRTAACFAAATGHFRRIARGLTIFFDVAIASIGASQRGGDGGVIKPRLTLLRAAWFSSGGSHV